MFRAIATFFMGLTGTLPMATPPDLAVYTKCQPDNISHWIGQRIDYKATVGWEDAATCMVRGTGDCKCMALVARETLNSCEGVDAQIIILRNKYNKLHAVALYIDNKGNRGFIDSIYRKQFDPGTKWDEVIKGIAGGPWVIVRQKRSVRPNGNSLVALPGLPSVAPDVAPPTSDTEIAIEPTVPETNVLLLPRSAEDPQSSVK